MQTASAPPFRNSKDKSAGSAYSAIEMFAGISDRQSPVRRLAKHEMLFSEGGDGGQYYEVLEGAVCNFRILHNGRRQILSFSFPGDLVGIGNEQICRCSCEAASAACVRCISSATLQRAVGKHPDLVQKLLDVATTELSGMHDHFIMVGRKSAKQKLASFLLSLARRKADTGAGDVKFELPVARAYIADFLDMTVETVSRRFTELRKLGVIDLIQTKTVCVHDLVQLEELAEGDGEGC
jgi:CRP-like cAMP-binding protein